MRKLHHGSVLRPDMLDAERADHGPTPSDRESGVIVDTSESEPTHRVDLARNRRRLPVARLAADSATSSRSPRRA